ncbi:hypothetical protein EB151_01400, partial [archaeon]|nr:hypothetical protein [archaeon]
KLLEDAASNYLDSIISPIEKAARESAFKSKEFEMKISADRSKLTSDILSGLSNAPKVLGSSDVEATQNIKNILADIQKATPQQQLDIIDRLISQTQDLATAEAAKFKVTDPAALEALNKTFQDQRKNIILLNQSEKENLQLLNLEIDINKRRSESAQKLLILQNQLIESDMRRLVSIESQRSNIDIEENRIQNRRKLPGFGFGFSERQIAAENIIQNRGLLQQRQILTRQETIGNAKSQLQNTLLPILTPIQTAFEKISKTALSEQPDLYKNLGMDKVDVSSMTDFFNLEEILGKINDESSLEGLRDNLQKILSGLDKTSVLFKPLNDQVAALSRTLTSLNKETSIFEDNAENEIKISNVNDIVNNQYISRLNILLQIEKAQRKVLNTIEIQEQILDTERSRPANFFGLGVTGKAEKQIQYDERGLALRQRRQNAQAVQNVQQQLNQFETFRKKIQAEGVGPDAFGFPASSDKIQKARTAIANLDTSKITNLDQAKDFVSELSKVRTQYGLQGEAAKTLADTEKEINSILNSNTDELDKMRQIQDILNGKVRQEAKDRQSIRLGFQEGFTQIKEDADTGLNRLAKDTPMLFRDGMVNAIKAAVKETDNLGDALLGVAANFLDTISTRLMEVGVSKLISGSGIESLFTAQKGGLIRAQSGMYISGTGSGDKYPALLENGEYVLNRNAVMAMGGPAALDTLNFSAAPRFASGGSFTTELTDIKAMEDGMTTFGLENSSLYKELRDAEIQKAEQDRQKKRARQAQIAQMVGSLVAAVATIGIGAGISKLRAPSGYGSTVAGKLEAGVGNSPEMMTIVNGKAVMTGRQTGGLIGSRLSDTIPGYMEGGLYNSPIVRKYGTGMQGGGMSSVANNSNTVNNNNANNAFNFNTTVNRDGTIQMGADSSTYKQQDVELSNNLNSKIYVAVLDVIREQQRFGGSLAGTRKV